MPKNPALKKQPVELEFEDDDFDFDFSEEQPDGEMIVGMMDTLIKASKHQMKAAVKLTELIIAQNPNQKMTEQEIFSVFERSSKVVADNFPLKTLWETFG